MTPSLRLSLLTALALLVSTQASADLGKLNARARAALAGLQAGTPAQQMQVDAQAVSESGELDVFVIGDVSRGELEAAGARVRTQAGDVFTAYVPPDAVEAVAALTGVRRIEGAALCAPEMDLSTVATNAAALRAAGPDFTGLNGAGVLVGDVDSGVDYGHGDFDDDAGNTRLVSIWDQTVTGTPPAGFGYGTEWSSAQIDANTCTQTDVSGHGTHVLGTIGGDGSQTGNGFPAYGFAGMAPRADLAMVKTTFMTTAILDGVNYIFQRATALGRNCAVNLSLGSHYGPHDGSSAFESGLDALSGPGRIISKSAGNDRGSNIHARVVVPTGPDSIKLTVGNGATSGRTLAIDGYYNSPNLINVTLRSPGNKFIGPIPFGSANKAYPGDTTGVNGRVYVENGLALTTRNDREIYIEIRSLGTGAGNITGVWTIYLTPVSIGASAAVDLWRYYVSTTSLTATFTLNNTNSYLTGEPGNADSVITTASWTTRRYWYDCYNLYLNFTGAVNPGNLSPYSSPGPTRDERPKPDIAAPGSAIISTLTQDISPTCPTSGTTFIGDGLNHQVMQGTSMAAPHVAGAAALIMQKYGAVSPSFVKQFLRDRALSDIYTGAVWNSSWGHGKMWLGDMADPAVAVTWPNGGEVLVGATPVNLTWTATDNVAVTTVDLLLSRDGANGTYETLASGVANSGSHPWTVSLPASENCWLKVVAHDAAGNAGADVSDALFAIVEPVVPTLMTEFVAEAVGGGIELRWAFSDPGAVGSVRVERAGAVVGPWIVLETPVRVEEGVSVAVDATAEEGATYWYRLSVVDAGTRLTFGPIQATAGERITAFALGQPVPNPASGRVRVDFAVPHEGAVEVAVYDMQGRRVAVLAEGTVSAGRHQALWNGVADGRAAPAGIYFLRLRAPGTALSHRLVVTR